VTVGQARQVALRAAQVEMAALDLEAQRLASGDVRDAASSARNAATVKGINVDKVLLMTRRPTEIKATITGEEAMRNLQSRGRVIDATAVEVDDAASPPELGGGPRV
jgi:hypothetical protein